MGGLAHSRVFVKRGKNAMANASTQLTASRTPPASNAASRHAPASQAEWWVGPLRWVALVVFIALPILTSLFEAYAGGVVWTIVIASLPVFIGLVGYHRWRRICPLAFLAQLPAHLARHGPRKAGSWLEAHYYSVALAAFFVSLWLRLIATNGDGHAISAFIGLLSLTALLVGLLYTGKTWCNYFCPVSFIEKIYTEPMVCGRRRTRSACRAPRARKRAPTSMKKTAIGKRSAPARNAGSTMPFLASSSGFTSTLSSIGDLALLLQRRLDPAARSHLYRFSAGRRPVDGGLLLSPSGAPRAGGRPDAGTVEPDRSAILLPARTAGRLVARNAPR